MIEKCRNISMQKIYFSCDISKIHTIEITKKNTFFFSVTIAIKMLKNQRERERSAKAESIQFFISR